MGKRLGDNLSSEYISAANKMKSKQGRRRIVAYVESYDDVFFWRKVLSEFENDKRYFEVMLPSKINLSKGKKQVLMNLVKDKVGKDMIACVDADYDFLIQGATAVSRQVIENPYVFHTYVYAIENYQCYAPSLHDVCVMVTLNDHLTFDFEEYYRQFSQAIFPLFVWNIMFYRTNHYSDFTMTDFNRVIETGNFNLQDPLKGIMNVRKKVGRKVRMLQQENPDAKEFFLATKDSLKDLGVTADTAYLYIQGHHLFDKVALPMMNKICDKLRRDREMEIRRKAVHSTQMHNELSCYTHSIEQVMSMLKKNMGYFQSEPYLRLKEDIKRFLEGKGKSLSAKEKASNAVADLSSTLDAL